MNTKKIYFITGAKGIGKSTTAARFARPTEIDKMVVMDCEDSMNDIVESNERMGVQFGAFIRAYEQLGNEKEREALLSKIAQGTLPWVSKERKVLAPFWKWFVETIDEVLVPGKFEYFVIDPVAVIEAAAAAWAESNKSKSGWKTRKWAQCEIEAVRPLIKNTLEAIHARGVHTILLTSHLKNPWVEYAPGEARPVLDKVIPSGRLKIWSTLTTAMLWLVPGYPPNANDAPSAIRMKARVGLEKVDKGANEWDIKRAIPPRIPAFSWRAWREYQKNGWDPLNPKPGETLLPHEELMLNELMTDKQYDLMIAYSEAAKAAYEELPSPVLTIVKPELTELEETIVGLASQGKNEEEIARHTGAIVPVVVRTLQKHYKGGKQ